MATLRFSDGVDIETGGEYRTIRLRDGLYVVGHGMCCPADSPAEAERLLARLARVTAASSGTCPDDPSS